MSNPIHQNRRALSATEVVTQLSKLNGEQALGWRLIDGALEKTFKFKNFYETMGFVNAVAFIANTEDHHPDLAVSGLFRSQPRRCRLRAILCRGRDRRCGDHRSHRQRS